METLVDSESEIDEFVCIPIPEDDPFFDTSQVQCMTLRRHDPCGESGPDYRVPKKPNQSAVFL